MTIRQGRVALLGISLCLLAACGGGGGSSGTSGTGSGGTGDSGVSMSLSTSTVSETATTDQSAPVATLQVFANGLTTGQEVYISGTYSENGIASMSAGTGSSPVTLSVQFKSPATLGTGVYHDTINLSECYDQACTQQVTNSPQTVSVTYTVSQAAPQVSSLYPTGAAAGAAGFTLEVDGSNFTAQSVVQWNGGPRQTAYVSATQIAAQISAADIALPGNDAVTISDPSSGVSNSVNFNVAGQSITSLNPSAATAYAPGLTLTVNGSNFTPNSVVEWQGMPLTTTYSSPTVLTAAVPTGDLANSGSVPVTVAASAGSQVVSSPQSFVVQPLAALSLDSIFPTVVYAGGPAFNLTVLGQGFTGSSAVQWNGNPRTTTYISTGELIAQIQASDLASAGTVSVTVQNPAAQGGTTSAQTVTITATQASNDAVAFQINAQHSGAVSFNSVTLPPPGTWTSPDLGGTPSYALIANGKVYLTVSTSGGSQLVALDRATGAIVGGPVAITGAANAAYDGGSVFVISSTIGTAAQIDAYDGNLSPLWSTVLTGQYVFSAAPTAADGFVFTAGAGSAGTLYAVSEATGGIAWSEEVNNGDDSTPAVTADGVYVTYPCWTYDFTPATGASIWTNATGCDGGGGGIPVVANGVLYAPNGFGSYSGTTFNAETGATLGNYGADNPPAIGAQTGYFLTGGTLEAVTLSSNVIGWSFAGDGELTTSPILISTPTNSYVFIGSASGMLYGLDAATGAVVWSVNVGAALPAGASWGAGIPLSGLAAGDGLLVVPAGTKVIAYALD
ncbi:MAG: PQQ-binding-like beta-propeller repeat protein [Steroidobacteraceae bacterium]